MKKQFTLPLTLQLAQMHSIKVTSFSQTTKSTHSSLLLQKASWFPLNNDRPSQP